MDAFNAKALVVKTSVERSVYESARSLPVLQLAQSGQVSMLGESGTTYRTDSEGNQLEFFKAGDTTGVNPVQP